MELFDFLKKKTFSNEKIEEEYQKALDSIQQVDNGRCSSLTRDMKAYAEKFYSSTNMVDPLAQKSEFMRIYAFRAYQWHCYHTLGYKKGKFNSVPLWTQKWHNYEQGARLQAQKRWQQLQQKIR